MPLRFVRQSLRVLVVGSMLWSPVTAQQPRTGDLEIPPAMRNLPPEQVRQMLRQRPDLAAQVRERIAQSGLTPDQVRTRLRAAGYPEALLDDYLAGADTARRVRPGAPVLDAMRTLGIVSAVEQDSLLMLSDSALAALDSARADSARGRRGALRVFGLDLFQRSTTQFQPVTTGPVDDRYRLGPGDQLVLILTGDVEAAYDLEVTREGFVVIPQVGQLSVANLTLAQLEDLLYARLGRAYSGVRRGPGATTRFQVSLARLRSIQVFVVGDVARPGSYQVSAAGTALTALYAALGPTERGSFRRIMVRRGSAVVDTLDLYDYLLRGDGSRDPRLQTGDVVFVPPRGAQVKATGALLRPAIYELRPGETLRDLIAFAGGFEATSLARVQIDRILPLAQRGPDGKDRVVLDLAPTQFADGRGPAFVLEAGDSLTVYEVRDRRRDVVRVTGAVWVPGAIGFTRGMRVSEAIRLAGGPKPDVYLGSVVIGRLRGDSTRFVLRTALADTTGVVTDDLELREDDEIELFSRATFRSERYVAVTGAVRRPGRVAYRDGLTMRDAILEVGGLLEFADLREAEVARLPADRTRGRLAETLRVALDSTYLFDRDSTRAYRAPPGAAAAASGAAEFALAPYDNVTILRQPDWEYQRIVSIAGAVRYPGRYALTTRTERLSDLIGRAGGLTREAYPLGVEFIRNERRLGRVGIDLPRVLRDPAFRDNLILVGGDSVLIPEYKPVVTVGGAVNAPTAVTWVPGQDLDFYVRAAGGYARLADKGRVYVQQPSGKVESVARRFLVGDYRPTPLAGANVFVPGKDPNEPKTPTLQILTTAATLLASLVTVLVVARQ